ncbi:hypothetical protein [Methanoregula sp.]|uniref:hypothetical protein n=1 Tax=Methanoregula sp. TaxID=2052170 RepID=UPI003566804D
MRIYRIQQCQYSCGNTLFRNYYEPLRLGRVIQCIFQSEPDTGDNLHPLIGSNSKHEEEQSFIPPLSDIDKRAYIREDEEWICEKPRRIFMNESVNEMSPQKLFFRNCTLFLTAVLIISGVSAINPDISPAATPFIAIDPCGIHTTGEEFVINGTTNLAVSNESLLLQIGTAEFNPGGFGSSFYMANVSVQRGNNGENVWSAEVLPSRWQMYTKPPNYYPAPTFEPAGPGNYQVVVSSKNPFGPDIIATQQLILVSSETGNNSDFVQPVVPSKNVTGIPEFSDTTPHPSTARSASDIVVPGIAICIGVVATAGLLKKKDL